MTSKPNSTFIKLNVTNRQIYDEIKTTQAQVLAVQESLELTNKAFKEYKEEINKKFGLVQKLVIGAYAFSMTILGWLVSHLMVK